MSIIACLKCSTQYYNENSYNVMHLYKPDIPLVSKIAQVSKHVRCAILSPVIFNFNFFGSLFLLASISLALRFSWLQFLWLFVSLDFNFFGSSFLLASISLALRFSWLQFLWLFVSLGFNFFGSSFLLASISLALRFSWLQFLGSSFLLACMINEVYDCHLLL